MTTPLDAMPPLPRAYHRALRQEPAAAIPEPPAFLECQLFPPRSFAQKKREGDEREAAARADAFPSPASGDGKVRSFWSVMFCSVMLISGHGRDLTVGLAKLQT